MNRVDGPRAHCCRPPSPKSGSSAWRLRGERELEMWGEPPREVLGEPPAGGQTRRATRTARPRDTTRSIENARASRLFPRLGADANAKIVAPLLTRRKVRAHVRIVVDAN